MHTAGEKSQKTNKHTGEFQKQTVLKKEYLPRQMIFSSQHQMSDDYLDPPSYTRADIICGYSHLSGQNYQISYQRLQNSDCQVCVFFSRKNQLKGFF